MLFLLRRLLPRRLFTSYVQDVWVCAYMAAARCGPLSYPTLLISYFSSAADCTEVWEALKAAKVVVLPGRAMHCRCDFANLNEIAFNAV